MSESDDRTLWCGNLSGQVTEELLYELFLQAGPLEKVKFGKSRDGKNKNYAFITYKHDVSVPYAINLFRGTTLFSRTLLMKCRGRMAPLPPPIRFGPDNEPVDFHTQPGGSTTDDVQPCANTTENLQKNDASPKFDPPQKRESDNKLAMDSLQGNWTHRHHPYRGNEQSHGRDNHGLTAQHHSRSRGHWRTRRPLPKKNYY